MVKLSSDVYALLENYKFEGRFKSFNLAVATLLSENMRKVATQPRPLTVDHPTIPPKATTEATS